MYNHECKCGFSPYYPNNFEDFVSDGSIIVKDSREYWGDFGRSWDATFQCLCPQCHLIFEFTDGFP